MRDSVAWVEAMKPNSGHVYIPALFQGRTLAIVASIQPVTDLLLRGHGLALLGDGIVEVPHFLSCLRPRFDGRGPNSRLVAAGQLMNGGLAEELEKGCRPFCDRRDARGRVTCNQFQLFIV